jgi:hypothetical protein
MAALPTILVRIAFATDPLASSPTWTDVTSYIRGFSIRRGRTDELGRMETGQATIILDNRDRRFDPTHTSGPYYPNVLPMRKVNIRATWNSVTYDLYTGFIERWPIDWPAGQDSTIAAQAVDGFMFFGNTLLTYSIGADNAGTAINAMVAATGWPIVDRSINGGASTLQAWSMTSANVLQQFQLLADSENGFLWMGGDGKIYFRERSYRLTASVSTTSQATFGDGGASELGYLELEPEYDTTYLYNDVHVARVGGTEQIATDTASQAKYTKRSLPKSGLLIGTDNEANDAANYLLERDHARLLHRGGGPSVHGGRGVERELEPFAG